MIFEFFKLIIPNSRLIRINIAFILSIILIILAHIQLKDIIKKRLAKDGEDSPVGRTRRYILNVVKMSSYVSCFYIIIKGYNIISSKYYDFYDYLNLYRMSADLFICILLYLTLITVNKFLIRITKRPKMHICYDILMLIIYLIMTNYVINVNITN